MQRPSIRSLTRVALLVAALASSLVVTSHATAADAPDAAVLAQIAAARPLDDVRVGISEQEPEYCRAEIQRATNPSAANKRSVEVGPPKFLVEDVDPGTTWRHCVSIYNRSPESRTVRIDALDVVGSLDPDVRLETREPVGAGSWLEFPVETLVIDPGERVLVPYLVRFPAEVPGGTSTAGISVADVTNLDQGNVGGALITRKIITQLQVTMPGGEAKPIKVTDVSSPRLVWTGRDQDRLRARFTVANEGTIVDTVTPSFEADGLFGREVARVKGAPEVLIPQSAQEMSIEWAGLPWIGVYSPTIVVRSTTGDQRIALPRIWIVPPWPYVLALIVALVLLVFGIVRRRRAWRRYVDEEAGADAADREQWDEWADESD